ncbi:AGE family epimerase/isomerase [Cohaesibacter celericrescens]|uniref:AGE family epimerase/isomerase n=1 Tax=Cohaesibacter celericrescens TaxID=2067669 RepID=UPI003563CEC4
MTFGQTTFNKSNESIEDVSLFACDFVPRWLKIAFKVGSGPSPVVESLDAEGNVIASPQVTTLTQSRTLFMLAHLHLQTGRLDLLIAAKRLHAFLMSALQDDDGGFRFAVAPDGTPIDTPAARLRRTYDQSFVLLALCTLQKADPQTVPQTQIDTCWSFIETVLHDHKTGALWEDDQMGRCGPKPDDLRSQNPHMHMLEATLQAYEMSGDILWLQRAGQLVSIAEQFFIDGETGAIREFVGHDLVPMNTPDGTRREPGHQFEWDWLLRRYAGFSHEEQPRRHASRMRAFAENYCVSKSGPMAGAPYDAVDAAGAIMEESHLLWPLTEAGKTYALLFIETKSQAAADRAQSLAKMIFTHYVRSDIPAWINQLAPNGDVLWNEGLSRLLYHITLFVTEGLRAGLWVLPPISERIDQ